MRFLSTARLKLRLLTETPVLDNKLSFWSIPIYTKRKGKALTDLPSLNNLSISILLLSFSLLLKEYFSLKRLKRSNGNSFILGLNSLINFSSIKRGKRRNLVHHSKQIGSELGVPPGLS